MSQLSDSDSSEDDARPSFGGFGKRSLMGGGDSGGGDPDNGEPHSKFIKTNTGAKGSVSSEKVSKMMEKMGYKAGTGLGKFGQGRVEIVEASNQRGRRGLGLHLDGLEAKDIEWNFEEEEVIMEEAVEWCLPSDVPVPTLEEMIEWKRIGPKKREIDDEDTFCSPNILRLILGSKSVFDQLEPEEMRRARTRSNPYETIRGAFFLNRAAMKMANMDALLDFMFTTPKSPEGHKTVGPNELLYFADVCAGPGGFSEYVLWRKKGDTKGFGFTLRGGNDFKVEDFFAGPSEMFEPHYGEGGLDGDGDIFRPANQEAFTKFVLENTDGKGVHFVMADGGFSVEGQENIQEILSKQLYLCQFLVALSILREGGHFVCKLFDLFTPFSVGLVYLMYQAFEKIAIIKPVTSRPANSERYIVCKWKKGDIEPILQYMRNINQDLCVYMGATSKQDVNEIVPLETLTGNEEFFNYIFKSNDLLGRNQIIGLKKIQVFAQNVDLYEERQADVRADCLRRWQVPDEVRKAPPRADPSRKFTELIGDESKDYYEHAPTLLTHETLSNVKSVYDYMCAVMGEGHRFYILGLGKAHVFKWDGRGKCRWTKLEENLRLELPPDTLLEVEDVQELKGEGRGQRRQRTIRAIDALFLCGIDVRNKHYKERFEKLQKFVKAIRKRTRSDLAPVTVPTVFKLEDIEHIFDRLEMKIVKGCAGKPRLCYCTEDGNYFHPHGIYFIKTVKDPWMMALSRSANRKYWYNTANRESSFECRLDCIASVRDCKMNSLQWLWEKGVKVHDSQEERNPDKLSRDDVMNHIVRLMK
ncbi:cap-specific mRNA (nucleoside-2'-O-)-methyltransferase 1-like [Haliotis cracherodii]|uniref:cap-specific mRNA (nucleoside-2'-O-)-methyltransferase 1-like n=1 Tax=Haliotis cracherodii TaxID=6455 RepID=UPI0039E8B971